MVEHLTFEELLEFNSLTYNEIMTGTLATRVTSHVRVCKKCRTALMAIQNTEQAISDADKAKRVTEIKKPEKLR